jgi:nicotinate-nucleotide adenylyltransferase
LVYPPKRFAIFGGTFNPPHYGHVHLAQQAQRQAHLDQVFWIPSDRAPHKADHTMPSIEHRAAMVDAAIAAEPNFRRVQPPSPHSLSYGIDTFNYLAQQYPAQHWFWIVGLDTFQTLPRWYQVAKFVTKCRWLVAPRHLTSPQPMDQPDPSLQSTAAIASTIAQTLNEQDLPVEWTLLKMSPRFISSTQLRQHLYRITSQPSSNLRPSLIADWLPPAVIQYIDQHQLYRLCR